MRLALRRALIGLGGVLALFLLLALILPVLVDSNRYRTLLVAQVEKALGRRVEVGAIRLSLLGRLSFTVQDVRVANSPGFQQPLFLEARQMSVRVRLLSLLRRSIQITSLSVDAPRISIERDAAGQLSIADLLTQPQAAPPGGVPPGSPPGQPRGREPAAPESRRTMVTFPFAAVMVRDGRISFHDASATPGELRSVELTRVELRSEATGLSRRLKVSLSGALPGQGEGLRIWGEVGPLVAGDGAVPFDLHVRLTKIPAALVAPYLPRIPRLFTQGRLSADLQVSRRGTGAVDTRGEMVLEDQAGERALFRLRLSKALGAEPGGRIRVEGATLEMGQSALNVSGTLGGPEGLLDLTLTGERLALDDVERWLPGLPEQGWRAKGTARLTLEAYGPLNQVGVALQARFDRAEIAYRDAFLKPQGLPAGLRLQARLVGDDLFVDQMTFTAEQLALQGRGVLRLQPGLHLAGVFSTNAFPVEGIARLLPVLATAGVSGRSQLRGEVTGNPVNGGLEARGALTISTGRFREVPFTNLRADFHYGHQVLTLRSISGGLLEGTYTGDARLALGAGPLAYQTHSRVERVKVEKLLALTTNWRGVLTGLASASMELTGRVGEPETATGEGEVRITKGRVQVFDLMARLGEIPGLAGVRGPAQGGTAFEELTAQVRIRDRKIVTPTLALRGPGMELTARGSLGLDRALDYQAQALLSSELSARVSRGGLDRLIRERGGRVSLPLRIQGTLDAPKVALDERALRNQAVEGAGKEVRRTLEELEQRARDLLRRLKPGR